MSTRQRPRRIVFVVFDDLQSLDLSGPLETFTAANRIAGAEAYRSEIVAPSADPITTSSGLRLIPDASVGDCAGAIDTLVVAGGSGARAASANAKLVGFVATAAGRSRRVASVCTGAFVLARAGLLDDRRATTHWRSCAALSRLHPQVQVDPAPIYVRDGNVYTSAGVTAGIDLALALVEEDLGRETALEVARALVLFIRRTGGQAQFSAALAGQEAGRESIRALQGWIVEHLGEDLSIEALASRSFMSQRNFARVFAREVGITPAAYVVSIRVERARTLLETTDLHVDQIAAACGFGTVETLRRAFGRRVGVNPSDYRSRFAGGPSGQPDGDNVIPIPRRESA